MRLTRNIPTCISSHILSAHIYTRTRTHCTPGPRSWPFGHSATRAHRTQCTQCTHNSHAIPNSCLCISTLFVCVCVCVRLHRPRFASSAYSQLRASIHRTIVHLNIPIKRTKFTHDNNVGSETIYQPCVKLFPVILTVINARISLGDKRCASPSIFQRTHILIAFRLVRITSPPTPSRPHLIVSYCWILLHTHARVCV